VRILLDTHALLWWLAGDPQLSAPAHAAIVDPANDKFVSAASAWEIAIKFRLGKLPGARIIAGNVAAEVAGQGFIELPMTMRHAQLAGDVPPHHKDPFDRMLIAQATIESLPVLSIEAIFDRYGIHRIW